MRISDQTRPHLTCHSHKPHCACQDTPKINSRHLTCASTMIGLGRKPSPQPEDPHLELMLLALTQSRYVPGVVQCIFMRGVPRVAANEDASAGKTRANLRILPLWPPYQPKEAWEIYVGSVPSKISRSTGPSLRCCSAVAHSELSWGVFAYFIQDAWRVPSVAKMYLRQSGASILYSLRE